MDRPIFEPGVSRDSRTAVIRPAPEPLSPAPPNHPLGGICVVAGTMAAAADYEVDMRRIALLLVASVLAPSGAAFGATKTVPDVGSVIATLSSSRLHTIVLRVGVLLPNTCWTNPRLKPVSTGAWQSAGVADFEVLADVGDAPGMACGMIVRREDLPPFYWTKYPKGVRAVRIVGAKSAVVAQITGAGG